jgi:hypothetical protein
MRSKPLIAWHLLSLDAPTVAALWTWFLARVFGVAIGWRIPLAMFLAVWMLYAADRILDARRAMRQGTMDEDLELRHLFHHRHEPGLCAALLVAGLGLLPLLARFSLGLLDLDAALGLLLLGWFAMIHVGALGCARLPKEFAVGVFFSLALFAPVWTARAVPRAPVLLCAGLLAMLCTLNCLFIYAWEHRSAVSRAKAHRSTRLGVRVLKPLAVLLMVGTLAAAAMMPHRWPAPAAVGVAALLLVVLGQVESRVEVTTLRAAADFVLLTPLLFAAWLPPSVPPRPALHAASSRAMASGRARAGLSWH